MVLWDYFSLFVGSTSEFHYLLNAVNKINPSIYITHINHTTNINETQKKDVTVSFKQLNPSEIN